MSIILTFQESKKSMILSSYSYIRNSLYFVGIKQGFRVSLDAQFNHGLFRGSFGRSIQSQGFW